MRLLLILVLLTAGCFAQPTEPPECEPLPLEEAVYLCQVVQGCLVCEPMP